MRIAAIENFKGGVGKSVTSINMSLNLTTLYKKRVLLVDDDPQGNVSKFFGVHSYDYKSMEDVELRGLEYYDPLYEQVLSQLALQDMIHSYIALVNPITSISMPKGNGADSPLGILFTIGKFTEGTIYEESPEDPSYGHATNVYVSENVVAASFSMKLAEEEGRLIGNDALWTGCTEWNAPGLNIHRSQYNARNIEYYSEDPILTGTMGAGIYRQVVSYGMVAAGKHFAFNDQETNRDGVAVFLNEQAARENELRGFQIAMRDGNANSLMTAFNRIGCTHVGAGKSLMNSILRGEWGFNGVVITDSVKSAQYFLPSECLVADNDQMLGGSNNGKIWGYTAEEISKDRVLEAGVRESYHRMLYAYVNSNVMNGITVGTSALGMMEWWVLAFQLMTGINFVMFLTLFRWNAGRKRYKEMADNKNSVRGMEFYTGILTLVLALAGLVCFFFGFTTNYYTFGQMNSQMILFMILTGMALEMFTLYVTKKFERKLWPKLLTSVLTALLAAAAILLIGDRVEGIGNCIVTDYDSVHGGEEAIYYSLVSSALMLTGMIANIAGSFSQESKQDR